MKPLDCVPPALLHAIRHGVDTSASGLARMSCLSCQLETTSIETFSLERFRGGLAASPTVYSSVRFSIPGGLFVALFSTPNAAALADAFLKHGTEKRVQSALTPAAIAEISNILVNAVVNSLGDAAGSGFLLSAPEAVQDTKANILDQAMERFKICGRQGEIRCHDGAFLRFADSDAYFTIINYLHLSSPILPVTCNVFILLNALWGNAVPAAD